MSANNNGNLTGVYVSDVWYDNVEQNEKNGVDEKKNHMTFCVASLKPFKVAEGEPKYWYFRCQAWGRHASNIHKYVGIGGMCNIQYHLESGSYVDKAGNKVWTQDCKVDSVSWGGYDNSKTAGKTAKETPEQPEAGAPLQTTPPQPAPQAAAEVAPPAPQPTAPPAGMSPAELAAAADQLNGNDIPF